MPTKLLMIASALFLGAIGLVLSFLPQETLVYLCIPFRPVLPVIMQLLGTLYLSFGLLNWTAKDKLVGGIYSRPVSMGNFLHFAVGTLTLVKGASYVGHLPVLWALAGVYGIFAVAFTVVLFSHPGKMKG